MAPKFGTSGLRGLVTELTDDLVAGYATAFLRGAATDGTVLIGRDLRGSSPRLAAAVAGAAAALGLTPRDAGVLPTPALALAVQGRTAAVMVTGSHIPDDRNGLKFYTADGEITKADEVAIAEGYAPVAVDPVTAAPDPDPRDAYRARYAAFGPAALAGLRVGVYEHASSAREVLGPLLADLGATPVPLGRADRFVPVDTEALDPDTHARLAGWAAEHRLDAIVSTDGDADRPMLAGADGAVIPGDRLGPLTARAVGATTVVTPVSSNTLVEAMDVFAVVRTRIGSPHVIAAMAGRDRVAGYEANGGFLLGFAADLTGGVLAPLATRDAVLPLVAPLAAARAAGVGVADLAAALPPRFTDADRLTGVDPSRAAAALDAVAGDAGVRDRLLDGWGAVAAVDRTDGWRAVLESGDILHLRPSGNAPEFRVYAEASSPSAARRLRETAQARLADLMA